MTETKQTMPYKLLLFQSFEFLSFDIVGAQASLRAVFRIYRCILQKAKPIASDLAQRTRFFKMK
jgi:hypothetical protein